MEDASELKCNDCGISGEDVEETFCPYAAEIHGKEVEAVLCKDCYRERSREV